jgi:hypothetical protein
MAAGPGPPGRSDSAALDRGAWVQRGAWQLADLGTIFGEPGIERTPFPDPANEGWEDNLDVPRDSGELMEALTTTWSIVESCLERWTPDMLHVAFPRPRGGVIQQHTRHSVLTRMVMHDAFHCGEVSLLLGLHGRPSLDPWELPAAPAT